MYLSISKLCNRFVGYWWRPPSCDKCKIVRFAISDVPAVFPHFYVGCISVSPCQWTVKFEKALGCSKFHMQHGDLLLMIPTAYIIRWLMMSLFPCQLVQDLHQHKSHSENKQVFKKHTESCTYTYHTISMYSVVITIERNTPNPRHQHWSHRPVPFPAALLIKALWC